MAKADQTLMLRAYEIAENSTEKIYLREAFKQAALERYRDLESMAEAMATLGESSWNAYKKRQYELPDNSQGQLFDLPSHIVIDTPDGGPLLLHRSEATKAQAKQYAEEGFRLHTTQRLRFKQAVQDCALVDDLDDETSWQEARKVIRERKLEALEKETDE